MKLFLRLFLFVIVSPSFLWAQVEVNFDSLYGSNVFYSKKDSALFTGTTTKYYDNGENFFTGQVVNGKWEGERWTYRPDGKKLAVQTFKDGKKNGKEVLWHNDFVEREEYYENDKPIGKHKRFDYNGNLISETNYVDGMKDGYYVSYYNKNQKGEEGNYKEDKKTGWWKTWYANGKLTCEGEYKDGNKYGKWIGWNEDGSIHLIGLYAGPGINGVRVTYDATTSKDKLLYLKATWELLTGVVVQYYPTSDINRVNWKESDEELYENGEKTYALHFSQNGKLESEGKFKDNRKDGMHMTYRNDGSISYTMEYSAGIQNGKLIRYFVNGKKESEVTYVNGEMDGLYMVWDTVGKVKEKIRYQKGIPLDMVVPKYENGQTTFTGIYLNGLRSGMWTMWYENKKPRERGSYINGKRIGEWNYWDENGKLISKEIYADGNLKKIVAGAVLRDSIDYRDLKYINGLRYYKDDTIPFSGIAISYYPNGIHCTKQMYKLGKEHGHRTDWFDNGQVLSEKEYYMGIEGGVDCGKFVTYYKNGQKNTERYIMEGRNHGSWKEWYENGIKKEELNYSHGRKEGLCFSYDNKGRLKNQESYKVGSKNGICIEYDTLNKKVRETEYIDNEIFAAKFWHPNHVLYRDFKKNEYDKYYLDDSTMTHQIVYTKNGTEGYLTSYYPNGSKKIEGLQINLYGQMNTWKRYGKWIYYHDDGKPYMEEVYDGGNIVSSKVY